MLTEEWIEVDDLFELNQYLHRVSISFELTIEPNEKGEMEYKTYDELIGVRIWEGDDFRMSVPKEASEFYLNTIKKHLYKYEKEFTRLEEVNGSKELQSIVVNGRLEPGRIKLELHKTYLIIDYIVENKALVLIE